MDRRYTVFRYLAYSLEIIILYIVSGSNFLLPEILGGRPLLLIPVALTIAFFENEFSGMFFGLACGVMLDIGISGNIGFYAITLTIAGYVIGVIFRDYMVVSFANAMAFCSGFITGLIVIYFFIFYVFQGKGDSGYYFLFHYASRIIYTIVAAPLLYFLNKSLYRNLRDV